MAGIELQIGANVQPAITAINDMKLNLQKLKDQLLSTAKGTDEFNRLSNAIINQKNQIQQALAASNGFANSTFGVSRAARVAHNDLDQAARSIELFSNGSEGAVAGISNLVFTFERLQGVTGSTKGAIAAMGEAFLGPAGIILALGTALPLLEKFVGDLFESEDATERAKIALDGYRETLDRVKTTIDGIKNDLDFTVQLGAINNQANKGGDLEALRQQSAAQAQLSQVIRDQKEKVLKDIDDLDKNEDLTAKDRLQLKTDFNKKYSDLLKDEIEADEKQRIIYGQIRLQKVKDQDQADEKELEAATKAAAERKKIAEGIAKSAVDLLTDLTGTGNKIRRIFDDQIFAPPVKLDVPSLKNEKAFFDSLKADVNKSLPPIDVQVGINAQLHLNNRAALIDQTQKDLDQLNKIVTNGLADLAGSFAEGIGTILGGGDISSAFQAIFKSIGGAFQALGKAMIAQAIAVIAIKNAFKNPFVELAAGAGLIIAGTALQSAIGKAAKFAAGGLVSGPVFGFVGEGSGTSRSNPEVIAPLDKLKGMLGGLVQNNGSQTGEFRLSGNDLVLAINRTQRTQGRGG